MISITVKDGDRYRAARIANAYVDELHDINSRLIIGEASLRRNFFAQQLALEKDRLTDAEIALQQTEEKTGAIAPAGQTGLVIGQVAALQSQIISREVQLDTLRTSSTDQNPDVVRMNTEIEGLKAKLRDMESTQKGRKPGDITLTSRSLPEDQVLFLRKQRDVQYHTLIFDLIARQFEAARLDEAKASPVIQVLDPAEPPDKKSGPFRALWMFGWWIPWFSLWIKPGNWLICLQSCGRRRSKCCEAGSISPCSAIPFHLARLVCRGSDNPHPSVSPGSHSARGSPCQ